jgi:hypothetical protein
VVRLKYRIVAVYSRFWRIDAGWETLESPL